MSIEMHLIALTIAFFMDLLTGDPKRLPHPVVGMGKLISFFERKLNKGPRKKAKGIIFLGAYLLIICLIVSSLLLLTYNVHWLFGLLVEAWIISTTIATKGLKDAALQVYLPLKQNDFILARQNLAMIVGRDTENLSEGEIVRGTVETVAENTSDGVTAPLFFALIGGGLFAVMYRAVNTCDSMVGYKNEKFMHYGWASAKLDDILNYIPSRLTACIMLLVNKGYFNTKKECFQILLRDAKKHPSPNSGWLEAGMASLLGVQLGGRNTYNGIVSNRATMGVPINVLERKHIPMANTIMVRTSFAYVISLWVLGGMIIAIT